MSESLSDILARLEAAYAPVAHVRGTGAPVPVRRKRSDTRAPGGTGQKYPHAGTLDSRKRGGSHPATYRPTASDYANNPVPAMARATAPDVMHATGIKVTGGEKARLAVVANCESNGYRSLVMGRTNSVRDTGEVPEAGTMYPNKIGRTGRPVISKRNPLA